MAAVSRSIAVAAVAASLCPALSSSAPKPKPPAAPVNLEIVSPAYKPDLPLGTMYSSGTTLAFKATVKSSLGIFTHGAYVPKRGVGWIIFNDPDGCTEVGVSFGLPMALQPVCLQQMFPGIPVDFQHFLDPSQVVPDETFLQFRIDNDAAGVADFTSNPGLADPAQSGGPVFLGLTNQLVGDEGVGSPLPLKELAIGPFTGASVDDGFGYGADDDLTGLVVLSNRGVGVVYQDADAFPGTRLANFTPVSPRTLRNLAGFLESVSYELKSNNGKTVIHANMTLPNGLIAPILAVDNCMNTDPGDLNATCDAIGRYQVDGGPFQTGADVGVELWSAVIPAMTFEIRAFIVSGTAPSQLADLNGDGKVTAADAKLAGYKLVSDEAVTQFRQFPSQLCSEQDALSTVFGADFDGNGYSAVHSECPPGPGSLKGIP